MKKVFEKMSRGIFVAAIAAVIFVSGKAEARASEQINLDQEYNESLVDGKTYEYSFVTPERGSFHIETELNISDTENVNYCSVGVNFTSNDTSYWNTYLNVNDKTSSLEYSLKPGQQATLKFDCILHGYSADKKYDLKFKIVTNKPENCEKEGNDKASTASKIKLKKKYCGILNAEDKDVDWYVFKAPKSGKYRFYVNNTSKTGKSTSIQVYGYKTRKKLDSRNGNTVIEGTKEYKSKAISLKKGKKYYIKLEYAHPCNASYEIKIKKVK